MIKTGFSLVERGQLDKVLAELKIQDTALIDPATAAKIGKLSGADLMLLGEITDSDSLVVINARLMETATGRSVAAERVELRKVFARN
jgi:TolB-like protein